MPGTPRILTRIPASKTRLTVVRKNGDKDLPKEFEGTIQVLGAGYYAVYVILSSNTITRASGSTAGVTITAKRQLMAINLDSTARPAPLDVPMRADVRLSAAADAPHLDALSFVDPPGNPMILAPAREAPTSPAIQRFAQLITCNGTAFNSTQPIPLPLFRVNYSPPQRGEVDAHQEDAAKQPLEAQTGWSVQNDHPVRVFLTFDDAATPPVPGGENTLSNH